MHGQRCGTTSTLCCFLLHSVDLVFQTLLQWTSTTLHFKQDPNVLTNSNPGKLIALSSILSHLCLVDHIASWAEHFLAASL